MKIPDTLNYIYNKFKHHSAEEIDNIVGRFIAYSAIILCDDEEIITPFSSTFTDYSRQVAQKKTYEILQADTTQEMMSRYNDSVKNYNEYFYGNFDSAKKSYLKYYNNVEKSIDRAKIDEGRKYELHYAVSLPYEQVLNKINLTQKEIDKYYLMIVNSTKDTYRYL